MPGELIRVLSDVHYGDRASRVRRLAQLQPLTGGCDRLIFNGDTLDTRVGPRPAHTAACREEVRAFAATTGAPVTFLTGNHDPDFSNLHRLELAHGEVLVLHGDVLFDEIVPWGRDAPSIRQKIAAAIGHSATLAIDGMPLDERIAIWRAVARSVEQRHQSERNPFKYALRFAMDTVWPPDRFLRIFRAWRLEPIQAAALVRKHHPRAKYVILGHTHRPAIRRVPGGPIVINTGSFCPPLGGYTVEIAPGVLRVRRIDYEAETFRTGAIVAEFPLANR